MAPGRDGMEAILAGCLMEWLRTEMRNEKGAVLRPPSLLLKVDPAMTVTWLDFLREFQEAVGFRSSLSLIIDCGC